LFYPLARGSPTMDAASGVGGISAR
jgi:hypothetical protein